MKYILDAMVMLKFDEPVRDVILVRYRSNPEMYKSAAQTAYQSDGFDYPICKYRPLDRIVIWCCLLHQAMYRYEQAGVPENVTYSTVWEVARLANQYHKKTGRIGLSKDQAIWLRHIYNTKLFQLGSLQFQMFEMVYLDKEGCGEDYIRFSESQKQMLPQGTPVINVHIPDEADLTQDAVTDAFALADSFFKKIFPSFQPKVYLCYSWLLYPPMDVLLPAESHIRAFASRFTVIGAVSDPYGADAVKYIYGKRYARKADYPQYTTLQRNVLGNFSKLGMACGIIEIT
ncbi:MAG: hypothetical protein IKT52_07060 [Oscillospiraceae bacterium]|nr:hypothetical protein [Oscillospiraceae bacterium]